MIRVSRGDVDQIEELPEQGPAAHPEHFLAYRRDEAEAANARRRRRERRRAKAPGHSRSP
jgi:hypothetical protein